MNEVMRVIRQASVRMGFSRFIAALVVLTCAALFACAGMKLAEKLGLMHLAWGRVLWIAPIVVVVFSIIAAWVRSPSKLAVARRVDEGADLRDSLATALQVQGQNDAWSQNVVEYARHKAIGVEMRRAVPIETPKRWYMVIVAGMALLLAWLAPIKADLLGKDAKEQAKNEDAKKAKQVQVEAKAAINKVEEMLAKADPGLKKEEGDKTAGAEKAKNQTPEEIQRAALKNLTSLKEKAQALLEGVKAKSAENLQDKLSQLKSGPGPLDKMVQALGKGDMSQAKAELEAAAKSLASGEMSEEDKKKMEAQLEKMAEQLKQLAQDKKALEEKLAQAGIDPKAASSPEALKQALEKSGLSQEAQQAIENAAQAQQNANSQCQNMGNAMSEMAQAMSKQGQQGQQGQEGQQQMSNATQQLSDQMTQAEMAQSEMNAAEAALSEANKQMEDMGKGMGQCDGNGKMGESASENEGTGSYKPGESEDSNGKGRGGPGISQGGGSPGESAAPEKWAKRKSKSPLGGGPSIGTMMVQGEQVKGEAKAEYTAAVEAATKQASDQVTNNVIPREYRDAVKDYFSKMQKRAGTDEFKGEPKKDAKPTDAKPGDSKPSDAKPAEKK
jgi:hypothetical protein